MWWNPKDSGRFRRAKYADLFNGLDRDGDGRLQRADLDLPGRELAAHFGWSAEDPLREHLRVSADGLWRSLGGGSSSQGASDGADVIEVGEFIDFFDGAARSFERVGQVPRWAVEPLLRIFKALDLDGDGFVSREEYGAYLKASGSDADASAAFALLDLNADGRLSLDEVEALFVQWLASGDPESPGNYLLTGRLPPA